MTGPARRAARIAASCLALLAGAQVAAQASSVAGERFQEAVRLEESGRYHEAVDALLEAERADPDGPYAAPALQRAGRVLAVRLFDFDAALELLDRAHAEHPSHPKALAAVALAERIRDGRAAGDEALRRFLTLRERPDLIDGPDEAIAELRDLADAHPDFPYIAEVLLDLGVRLRRIGRDAEAIAVFERARREHPGTPLAGRATLEIAETHFARDELLEAAAWFDRVGESGGSAALGRQNAERARDHHARRRIDRIGLAILGVWTLWVGSRIRWRRIDGRVVANALREATVLLPAGIAIVAIGPPTSPVIRHPIYWITLGTVAMLALGNLRLLTNGPGRRGRILHGGLTVLGILAMSYGVLYRYDLVFALEDALRFGAPDG